jgi:hypothetical protein
MSGASRIEVARRIVDRFAAHAAVRAVAAAGSLATGVADAASDVDLYVYAAGELPLAFRSGIAADADVRALGNTFFEPGDEWTDAASGVALDVMYRHPAWIEDRLDAVLIRHEASVGWSTCFWRNVLDSVPLFDRDGWFARLKERASAPYPEPLRTAILAKNLPLLADHVTSFAHQLDRAIRRGDVVSANHRAAAFLAALFDVLFALNRRPHPGEKRLLAWAARECPLRPPDLGARVQALIEAAARRDVAAAAIAREIAADTALCVAQGGCGPGRGDRGGPA